MQFKPAQSITEQVADHLAGEIITSVRPSGSRIQEMSLAKSLSVSRGSVREALLVLEGRHLVDILPRRGAVVSAFDKEKITEFSEVYGLLQLRLFKSLAARPHTDFTPLEGALVQMEVALSDTSLEAQLSALGDFLAACLANTPDYFLGVVMRSLVPVRLRLGYLAAQHRDYDGRDLLRYHRALFDAMVARDGGRIEELSAAYAARELQLAAVCPLAA
jgi:DNA-binding GntR family transcriptional regulator